MDTRLEQALDFSQYMTTPNNPKKKKKRLLLEKFYENCIPYYNGGKFTGLFQNLFPIAEHLSIVMK